MRGITREEDGVRLRVQEVVTDNGGVRTGVVNLRERGTR